MVTNLEQTSELTNYRTKKRTTENKCGASVVKKCDFDISSLVQTYKLP